MAVTEIVSAVVITLAVIVGFSVNYFTGKPDTPIEQLSEEVLRSQDIDIDFSADEKQGENQ